MPAKKARLIILILLALAPIVSLLPTALAQIESPQPTEVSILEHSAGRLALRISTAEQTLTIETRRGPETPLALRLADPLTPDFEIDFRILDHEGFPIYSQFGGHAPLDPTWDLENEDPFLAFYYRPDPVRTRTGFRTAAEAIGILSTQEIGTAFGPELESLKRAIPTLARLQRKAGFGAKEKLTPTSTLTSYRNRIAIHDAEVRFTFGLARHGATLLTNIDSSGNVLAGWSACNHGRCPDEMPEKCRWTSSLDRPFLTTAPLCSTPYSALSSSGNHNSNDDTEIQYDGVRGAFSPSPTAGKCSDPATNNEPDNCY